METTWRVRTGSSIPTSDCPRLEWYIRLYVFRVTDVNQTLSNQQRWSNGLIRLVRSLSVEVGATYNMRKRMMF